MLKPKSFVFVFVCMSLATARAQTPFDSLMNLADKAAHDTLRIFFMNEASVAIRETDNEQALNLATQANRKAQQLGYKRGVAMTLANIGWIYYRNGIFSQALDASNQALKIDRELGDKKEIVNSLNNIGAINFEQRRYENSLQSFKEALQLATQQGNRLGISRSLNNIAFCYLRLGKLDSAKYYTRQAQDGNLNDFFRTSFSFRMLGDISFEEKNFGEALKHYETCLTNAMQQNNNFLRVSTQYRIGKALIRLGQIDRAISLLTQNILLAKKFKYPSELESTYLVLSDAYKAKGDLTAAMEYQTRHYQLKDSLSEQRRGAVTQSIQSRYDSEIKNAQIELLTKDAVIKENELRAQRLLMYVGIAILVILALLIFNLIQSNQRNKAANRMLSVQNELIQDQSRQVEVLNKTKDKILSIISHDMRSPLAGLKGLVNLMGSESITQQEFVDISKNLRKNLDYVYNDLDNLLHWANAQLKGIKPQFENVVLRQVVLEKVNLFGEVSKNKTITFEVDIPENVLVWADINHLGLIIRNLLSNAIKFSHANSCILITARSSDNEVNLFVQDFGVGMEPEDLKQLFKIENHFSKVGTQNEKGIGLGLILVNEFVKTNRGSIAIESKVGTGSTFSIVLQRGHT
jgi:two-component system, sensor histidine kinase and response regulator